MSLSLEMHNPKPKIGVVIAGAVARGAYEAAALATILPKVLGPDTTNLSNVMFFGTSAGAINAALWAGLANGKRTVAEIGKRTQQVWSDIDDTKVFASLFAQTRSLAKYAFGHNHLLDTSALANTVRREFRNELTIHANIREQHVGGVAIAATFCGQTVAGARAHVFWEAGKNFPLGKKPDGAIDLIPDQITPSHVLASSAVPVLFAPIKVGANWYVDGGVKLNTPIAPAIAFGADYLVVVSSHSADYPKSVPASGEPVASHQIGMALHSVLADSMIEDLRRLRQTNALLEAASTDQLTTAKRDQYRLIPHAVVAPPPGELATLAAKALAAGFSEPPRPASFRDLTGKTLMDIASKKLEAVRQHTLDGALRLFTGGGPGSNELLSYVLFDREYFVGQYAQARSDASAVKRWSTTE